MTERFPHLLSPLPVGKVILPNRVIMGSMHLGLEDQPEGASRLAAFYAERALGGVALIVTGGVAPCPEGRLSAHGPVLQSRDDLGFHRKITSAVHEAGGRILMQILHAGRYAGGPGLVAPSALQAPINPRMPKALTPDEIERTLGDFASCAALAREAGYDGVEIMGSEGYLISSFLAPRANKREDEWGGSPENRRRFATEAVRRARQAVGDDFLIMFRLSMADLVEEGSSGEEIVAQAQAIEQAGADILNSGIGWHEARVPTIAHAVPPAAFVWATARVKKAVRIPVAACNRINKPELAEAILAQGEADLVSMARPFLADPHFVAKAKAGKPESINICIACNQACLDAIFSGQPCSCLVNPRACRESELAPKPARKAKAIAVVGSGPAGLACAAEAASRGHRVTLFEAKRELGGQFRLASRVPGKQEFAETARYFAGEFTRHGGTIRTGTQANASDLAGFDAVVLATGAKARMPAIPGIGSPIVASYEEILDGSRIAGERVAIIGAGGIGFNVAEFLCRDGSEPFSEIWGIDPGFAGRGALKPAMPLSAKRKITLLQRKAAKPGGSLGKTTGWIHRALLQQAGVKMLGGVTYRKIDSQGLHITIGAEELLIEADTVIICAGQEPERSLLGELSGPEIHVIGGAEKAEELDARRAIEQGVLLAQAL